MKEDISELGICSASQRILKRFGLTTISTLLNINLVAYKRIVDSSTQRRFYFDEIFMAVKRKGLSYAFAKQYYKTISAKYENLEEIKIMDLELSFEFRKYLKQYANIQAFLKEIAVDKGSLNKFLNDNIAAYTNYEWLYDLLETLGNDGLILSLLIRKYQKTLEADNVMLVSPLKKILKKGKLLSLFNEAKIYTVGDLAKLSREEIKTLDKFAAKKVEEIVEILHQYGFTLGCTLDYRPLNFSLRSISINVLNLPNYLYHKVVSLDLFSLEDLLFKLKSDDFSSEEIGLLQEALHNIKFDVTKPFLYAKDDEEVLRGLSFIEEERHIDERLREINNFLRGVKPLNDEANLKSRNTPLDLDGENHSLKSDLPIIWQESVNGYGELATFLTECEKNPKELNKFLYFNINEDTNLDDLDATLKGFGNDGVVLGMIIKEYQGYLKKGEVLYQPLDKVFPKGKILDLLINNEIYFWGDLINLSREKLALLDGFNLRMVNTVERVLNQKGYFWEEEVAYRPFKLDLLAIKLDSLELPTALRKKIENLEIKSLKDLMVYPYLEYFSWEELALIRVSFDKLGFDLTKYFTYVKGMNEALQYNNLYFEKLTLLRHKGEILTALDDTVPLLSKNFTSEDYRSKIRKYIY